MVRLQYAKLVHCILDNCDSKRFSIDILKNVEEMIFSSIYSNSMKNNKNMYYRLCTYVCTLIYEQNNFELIFHGVEGNSQ